MIGDMTWGETHNQCLHLTSTLYLLNTCLGENRLMANEKANIVLSEIFRKDLSNHYN